MHVYVLFSLIFFQVVLTNEVCAQDDSTRVLKLYNIETGKELEIKDGSEIKLIAGEESTFVEEFSIQNDSIILMDGKEYSLNDITDIKYLEKSKKIPATVLTLGGSIVLVAGIIIMSNSNPDPGFLGLIESLAQVQRGFIVALFGAGTTAAGGIIILNNRSHKKSKGWEFRIE